MMFTTPDRDNDNADDRNCGQVLNAGWWFNGCKEVLFTVLVTSLK